MKEKEKTKRKIVKLFDEEILKEMKIGERYEFERGSGFTKVPGGWIYESWPNDETGICCFIPE